MLLGADTDMTSRFDGGLRTEWLPGPGRRAAESRGRAAPGPGHLYGDTGTAGAPALSYTGAIFNICQDSGLLKSFL